MDTTLFKPEERAIFALRALYRQAGYLPFKMSKFEEYDLYVRNKDFLVSDSIITFNDTDGKLLALKPDVTLSIIKNYTGAPGCTEKVYYNENVYRLSGSTHAYKEIPQTGLECLGAIDTYHILEVVSLAAKSLEALADDYVLDISHLGLVAGLLEPLGTDAALHRRITHCLSEKNRHELRCLCEEQHIAPADTARLLALIDIAGPLAPACQQLASLDGGAHFQAALEELRYLCRLLEQTPFASHLRLDFSLINDMNYYNGIVFRGYLPGIPEGVLSGGQYDHLLHRLGKDGGAIGFAVYLDLLEQYSVDEAYDVDVLLLYDAGEDPALVHRAAEELAADGSRVTAQCAVPPRLRFARRMYLINGKVVHDD